MGVEVHMDIPILDLSDVAERHALFIQQVIDLLHEHQACHTVGLAGVVCGLQGALDRALRDMEYDIQKMYRRLVDEHLNMSVVIDDGAGDEGSDSDDDEVGQATEDQPTGD